MISPEQFARIKQLQSQGLKASQIATDTSLSAATVRSWMPRKAHRRSPAPKRKAKLDAYKLRIDWLLHDCAERSAQQIYQTICEEGYSGGLTMVKSYVRAVRPPKQKKVYQDQIFLPGEAAQVDFGHLPLTLCGNCQRKAYLIVIVLCHSRQAYIDILLDERLESWLLAHRRAFEAFGGVPEHMIVDRTKCAILGNDKNGQPIPNARYADMAAYYDFKIVACDAYCPEQKGTVENFVKYVKGNFMAGRKLEPYDQLRIAAADWCTHTANQRLHSRTGRRPAEHHQAEKPSLKPLPLIPYDCDITKTVLVDKFAQFSFDGHRYSLPPEYAHSSANLHYGPEILRIFADSTLIATHSRCHDKKHRDPIVQPEHLEAIKSRHKRSQDRKLLQRFLRLGQAARDFHAGLVRTRLQPLRDVRKILAIAAHWPQTDLLRALADATAYNAFGADYIHNLLHARAQLAETSPIQLTRRSDLLDLELPAPNLNHYHRPEFTLEDDDTDNPQAPVPS